MLELKIPREIVGGNPREWEDILSRGNRLLPGVQAGEPQYRGDLGWLSLDRWAGEEHLRRIEELGAEIRAGADAFVLIGVGGSNNAARSVIEALGPEGPEVFYAGNTLSPHELNRLLKRLDGKKDIWLDCIAKNFATLEPGAAFRVLRQYLAGRFGQEEAAKRIICTGTAGSLLEEISRRQGYRFLPFPDDIGGRYSAFSYVGLLPMAAAGVDVRQLAEGGREMEALLRRAPAGENPAFQYAALRNLCWQKGFRLEMLSSFEPRLRWFYKWWEQLFAESEGKEGRGIFPVTGEFSEELHSLGQFLQEGAPLVLETFLEVLDLPDRLPFPPEDFPDGFGYLAGKDFADLNRASFEATRRAHSGRLPCSTLRIGAPDPWHFGAMFYFFQFACYLSCRLMGVNPFDQPGVEAYKGWMFQALGAPGSRA